MFLLDGYLWAYCITKSSAMFMQNCICFPKNHFLSISVFFSKIICRIFKPRCVWMCESLWVYFSGTRSRKVISDIVCTSNNNIKVLLCILLFLTLGQSLSLSQEFTIKYRAWCNWMLKNMPWILVAFKISSRKKSTYSALFLVKLFPCLVSFETLCKIPDLLGPLLRSWQWLGTPVTHSSEGLGAGQWGADLMALCWNLPMLWRRVIVFRQHPPLELVTVTPQDGWREEESAFAYDSSPPGVGHEAKGHREGPFSL